MRRNKTGVAQKRERQKYTQFMHEIGKKSTF